MEENFLTQKTGLYKPEHRNIGIGQRKVNETYEFFNTVDCNTVKKLYNVYILDFILFEYELFEHLKKCLV